MAERLRPRTQAQIYANPVDTFVQQGEVDTTRLKQLSTFLSEVNSRSKEFVKRGRALEQGQIELQAKKDQKRGREAFSKLADKTKKWDDLVKSGEISASERPVFRYAFNESKGQNLGYEFIRESQEAYIKSGLSSADESSTFQTWFNKYKTDYIETHKDTLSLNGAFSPFDIITKQAQNNLTASHLGNVSKNFIDRNLEEFETIVLENLGKVDANKVINDKILDLNGAISPTQLNDKIIETAQKYYGSIFDPEEMKSALNSITTSKGNVLGDTRAAQMAIIAVEALTLEHYEKEVAKGIILKNQNKELAQDHTAVLLGDMLRAFNFNREGLADTFYKGEYDYKKFLTNMAKTKSPRNPLYKNLYTIGDDNDPLNNTFRNDLDFIQHYYPDVIKYVEDFVSSLSTRTLNMSADEKPIKVVELTQVPARKQRAKVLQWLHADLIDADFALTLLTQAETALQREIAGINNIPWQDDTYKNFRDTQYKTFMDQYSMDTKKLTDRTTLFNASFAKLFVMKKSQGGEEVTVWDNMEYAEKISALDGLMKSAIAQQDTLDEINLANSKNNAPIEFRSSTKYLKPIVKLDGKGGFAIRVDPMGNQKFELVDR